MAKSIYTKEEVNGARLAALLINEGTEAVRQKFTEELNRQKITLDKFLGKKKSNLESLLKQKRLFPEQYALMYPSANLARFDLELLMFLLEQLSGKTLSKSKPPASVGEDAVRTKIQETLQEKRTSLNEFLKTKKKNMTKLKNNCRLHSRRYALLYPTSADIETFDLTLLILLFKLISTNAFPTSEPSDKDVSLEDDLDRMRRMRNRIYGHVNGTGVNDDVFEQQWKSISSVLVRLGVKKKRINKWKRDAIAPDDMERFKKRLVEVMESDMDDVRSLQNILLFEVRAERKDVEKVAARVKETHSSIEDAVELLRCLVTVVGQQPTQLLDLIENINTEQTKMVEKLEVREMFEEIRRQLVKVEHVIPMQTCVTETPSLSEMATIYKNHPEAFQILIISAPDQNENQRSLDRCCKALGHCKWNIVLDMNEHSQSKEGIYDRVTTVFRKHTDLITVTYNDMEKITKEDQHYVAQGKRCLWIFANGCSSSKCPPSTAKFSKVLTEFAPLFYNILRSTLQIQPVICTTITLTCATWKPVCRLTERIREVCESAELEINYEATQFINIHIGEDKLPEMRQDESCDVYVAAPIEQLTTCFENTFGAATEGAKYWYPGMKGLCYLESDEMASFSSCMTLYHRDIGLFEKGKTPDEVEEIIQNTKTKFLRGEKITPEALYIHESGQDLTFVKRCEMKELKENVEIILEKRGHKSELPVTTFNLFHDVSGGGTTCGRYLLYSLRDKYPCIEIGQTNITKLRDKLNHIYRSSKKPLLIVTDDSKDPSDEITTFVTMLNNDLIKALVVIVRPLINTQYHKNTDRTFYIRSKIDHAEDLNAFRKLYDHQKRSKHVKVRKVFLFGLLAFTNEYQKLNETVRACLENTNENQLRVIRLTCLLWKYSHDPIPIKALVKLMPPSDVSVSNEDDLLGELGGGSDLLVGTGRGIKPAHICVVDALVECADDNLITTFVADMAVLVKEDDSAKRQTSNILQGIFIEREVDRFWSEFMLDLVKSRDVEYGGSVLKQFIELMQGTTKQPYLKALFARYLMYMLYKPEDSVNMAKEALALKQDESVVNSTVEDSSLLFTYGNLVREKVKKRFPDATIRKTNEHKDTQKLLDLALEDMHEAICAYRKAQLFKGRHQRFDVRPFVMEAKARYEILLLFFKHKCNKDHAKFNEFIHNTTIDLLRESEGKAMEVLDRLNLYRKLDKISDDSPTTAQIELDTKFGFLRLRTDTTTKKIILTIPPKVPCDVAGIVRHWTGQRRPWTDLNMEDLEIIFTKLDERMTLPNALAKNYEDIITAMICLRSRKKQSLRYKKYNMYYARECADLWKKKFKQDFDAWFMYGVLTLLIGMREKSVVKINEALLSLQQCQQICKQRDSVKGFRGRRYIIGDGEGLEKLVPYTPDMAKGELERFIGRRKHTEIVVDGFEYTLKVKLPKWEDTPVYLQEKLVQFNMVLARDNILAVNVEKYELPETE